MNSDTLSWIGAGATALGSLGTFIGIGWLFIKTLMKANDGKLPQMKSVMATFFMCTGALTMLITLATFGYCTLTNALIESQGANRVRDESVMFWLLGGGAATAFQFASAAVTKYALPDAKPPRLPEAKAMREA